MASKKKKPVEVVVFENPEKKKLGKEYLGKKKVSQVGLTI